MKLSARKLERGRKVELQMTSMIDVVFLLLIFFMVTASFVKTERNLDSAIKVNKQAASQASSHLEPAIVDVSRGASGFVYRIGGRETASQQELENILRQFDNKLDGAFVKVSDNAPFSMAAAAVQACKSAGFVSVSYVPSGNK
ncbi:MAG: biopolymer transporter ExbD [Planctomycetales bacterium]|nr:biopolymer transporter ExbD [Planctomycetales bacterium]